MFRNPISRKWMRKSPTFWMRPDKNIIHHCYSIRSMNPVQKTRYGWSGYMLFSKDTESEPYSPPLPLLSNRKWILKLTFIRTGISAFPIKKQHPATNQNTGHIQTMSHIRSVIPRSCVVTVEWLTVSDSGKAVTISWCHGSGGSLTAMDIFKDAEEIFSYRTAPLPLVSTGHVSEKAFMIWIIFTRFRTQL